MIFVVNLPERTDIDEVATLLGTTNIVEVEETDLEAGLDVEDLQALDLWS